MDKGVIVASAILVALAAMPVHAWDVHVRADEETGGLISVGISDDSADMNWIQGDGCTNMPWVTSEYRWGTGTLKVNGRAVTWNHPISNADGCSVYRPVDGLEICVRRLRKGDGLEETYEWRNVSAKPVELSEIDVHTPFRDDYLPRREMWTRRCFAHVWAGGSSAWVCAMRMGGKAPHLGLAVTAGAVDAYEIKLRGQQTGSSDYRGVIALSPPDVTLVPGSSASVSWRLFPFADKTDFFRRVRELGGVSVTASDWTVTRDEPVDITFEWKGGKVTKRVAYVREGLVRVPFEYDGGKRTFAELNAIADPMEHVLRRARFLVAHQQVNEPDSPYYGAFTQYDMETGRQRRWWEVGGGPDMEPGAERLGIGVSLAVLAQLGYKDEFLPPLRRYADFILKLCRPDNYVYASLSPQSRKRDFNSPWAVEFFLEMYKLTDERRYLTKAYELMLANVLRKGTLIEVESPDSGLVKVLRSAGLTEEADRIVNALVGHKDLLLRNARTSERIEEVGFAPEYASSRILQFLAAYDFVGDSRYLQDAVNFVPVFEANLGPQPSAWCHDIGLHHWDGFWFGKRRCWGDTLPNHWNGTGADAIAELARHGVAPGMDGRRAWSIGRQVLTLIRPDGGGGCAFVYPDRVNGRPAKFLDPLANDQDWVMLYYLRNSHGRKNVAASSPKTVLRKGDRVVWIGDSITYNGHSQHWGFVNRVIAAAKATGTAGFENVVGKGVCGWGVCDWLKDKGVLTNRADVIVVSLGVNDIGVPTVSSVDEWAGLYDRFLTALSKSCRPRQFVLTTITPLTLDEESPKNICIAEMNMRIKALAARRGATVIDFAPDVWASVRRIRALKTGARDIDDLVHPKDLTNLVMARTIARDLGGPEMLRRIDGELAALWNERERELVNGPAVVCEFKPRRRENVPTAKELSYDIPWHLVGTDGADVTVEVPDGFKGNLVCLSATNGLVRVSGVPAHASNPVKIVAHGNGRVFSDTVAIPAPWLVSPGFRFESAWQGGDWITNAVPPVRVKDVKNWRIHQSTFGYRGDLDPWAVDLRADDDGLSGTAYYLARRLYVPRSMRLKVLLSTDFWCAENGINAWLDGQKVFDCLIRTHWSDRERRPAQGFEMDVKPGWHDFVLLTNNRRYDHDFYCRFVDAETGLESEDLRFAGTQGGD